MLAGVLVRCQTVRLCFFMYIHSHSIVGTTHLGRIVKQLYLNSEVKQRAYSHAQDKDYAR